VFGALGLASRLSARSIWPAPLGLCSYAVGFGDIVLIDLTIGSAFRRCVNRSVGGRVLGMSTLRLGSHYLRWVTKFGSADRHAGHYQHIWLTHGPDGVSRIAGPICFSIPRNRIWLSASPWLARLVLFVNGTVGSPLGRAMRAVRDNELAAACRHRCLPAQGFRICAQRGAGADCRRAVRGPVLLCRPVSFAFAEVVVFRYVLALAAFASPTDRRSARL